MMKNLQESQHDSDGDKQTKRRLDGGWSDESQEGGKEHRGPKNIFESDVLGQPAARNVADYVTVKVAAQS